MKDGTTQALLKLQQLAFFLLAVMVVTSCSTKADHPAAKQPSPAAAAQSPATNARPTLNDQLREASQKPSSPLPGEDWQSLFNGKTLAGWRETEFAGRGDVRCQSGLLVLNMGDPFTGINWTNDFPTTDYEIALDAMRVSGSDFFCGLTVPVRDSFCSLIVGGWGGSLVGISSFDGMDASENETTKFVAFEQDRWYRIRMRVTGDRIEAWIDNDKLINIVTTGRKISLRPGEIEMSKPFGLASWNTTAAMRQIKLRRVDQPDGPPKRQF